MKFTIDARDVTIYSSASHGFRGIFDENGKEVWEGDKMQQAYDYFNDNFPNIRKCETLQEIIDMIKPKTPYSLVIKEGDVILDISAPNGYYSEFTWGNEIIFAQVQ